MMTEVGGKLKAGLLVASVALFGVLAFSARTADIVKIKGEACEKFVPGQSKSSIRVRVTDKASYKAVSQVENLADVRSRMLEHDFNVIVYNLVDNYVRDLMVRTTSQNDKELCVKVTGALLASDIDTVVANYSPNTPAPEYDIKEAVDACRYYFEQTGRRITFEYSLVAGVNDTAEDAAELAELVRGINCHINLIPVNPIKERSYRQPDDGAVHAFQKKLERNGLTVTVRREMGRDIDGACGQLRRKHMHKEQEMEHTGQETGCVGQEQ